MRLQAIAFIGWLALFGLVAVVLAVAGAPAWSLLVVAAALVGAVQVYCSLIVPRGTRARLVKAVDPTAGPPPGAMPVEAPLLGRLDTLVEAKDWRGLRPLLSDDFAVVVGKRRYDRRVYVNLLKSSVRRVPGEHTTEQVVAHPDEPDVLWVRVKASGKPRFGPGFVSTTWMRFTLTPDGSRLREVADAGVLHVA